MSARGLAIYRALKTWLPKRRAWAITPLVLAPALLAGASWWLTEPLELAGPSQLRSVPSVAHAALIPGTSAFAVKPSRTVWPEARVEGEPAKRLLLKALLQAGSWLSRFEGYSAVFHKQERIHGTLSDEQSMLMKIRQSPFSVYLKYLSPQAGKEVVYAEGRYDNQLIAHMGGLSRLLLPRVAFPPTHALVLAENRHPITEAGLAHLVTTLIKFRKMDLTDSEAVTILDRTRTEDGRNVLRSVHEHRNRHAERPYARVVVLYDPETFLPIDIANYDWPEPGQTGDLLMAERYSYENLQFDVQFSDLDFDPANPAYAFQRY